MVGSSIKKLRKERNFTQKELADILGVSRQAICMWEANKRKPDVAMLHKIARFFAVTLDEIVRLQEFVVIRKEVENIFMQSRRKKTIPIERKETNMVKKIKQKRIDFELMAPQANRVVLSGDFSSWDEDGILMRRVKSGLWKTSVNLAPGRYEYKFIVDGQWWTDPANNTFTTNALGSQNSIKEVTL